MDVTFASSGALSRAHYAIVRKVEEAASLQEVDQALAFEIKRVHERLARAAPSIKECKECLVILLYISTVASPGFLPPGTFDFGLAHALTLAEVGRTIEEKRIGYLFCAGLMPSDHELRLMTVNTLRKDLESGSPGRMCLALDNLISFANEDILPAVQDVILDLVSHNYPHIRRRAILALRSLATFEPGLLLQGSQTIVKRLQDRNESVAASALAAAAALPTSDPNFANIRLVVNGLFSSIGISSGSALSLRILQCLQNVGLSETHIPFALDLIKSYTSSSSAYKPASLLGLFRLLAQHSPSKLIESENAQEMSAAVCLSSLLQSQDPNDHYLYLSCLLCIDPAVWAGTEEGRPLVLEGWEVEKVMGFLESLDDCIRNMTLTLLARIDPAILSTYLTHVLSSLSCESSPASPHLAALNVLAAKLLDVIDVLAGEDGERYASGVKEVLGRFNEAPSATTPGKKRKVMQGAVEKVLVHIRASMTDFRIPCATTLLTYLAESSPNSDTIAQSTPLSGPGPTFLVISAALAVEYVGSISVSPEGLLKALSASLKISTPIVQDALLVAILRLAAEVDQGSTLEDTQGVVEEVRVRSGAYIQKRCSQVLTYLADDDKLRSVVRGLSSATLPEFAQALDRSESNSSKGEKYEDEVPSESRTLSANSGSDTRGAAPKGKLRYAAYEPPKPMASLRGGGLQRPSSPQLNKVNVTSSPPVGPTAASLESEERRLNMGRSGGELVAGPGMPKADLISLDSPFVTEASDGDFERIWNELPDGARGWCEGSVDEVVRRLRGLDGMEARVTRVGDEVQVVVNGGSAAVRLKRGEDDSCLWRSKGTDAVKAAFGG